MSPRYYVMRLKRYGPLVPARLQVIDYEPGEPSNKRDRWPPVIEVVDIAGEDRPPEELTERFHWPPRHWKYAEPIGEGEYRYRFEFMRRAESNRLHHPVLQPHRRVDPRQLPLPDFSQENANVGQSAR